MNLYSIQLSLKKWYQERTEKIPHISQITIDVFAFDKGEAITLALDALRHQGEFDTDSVDLVDEEK